MVKSKKKRAFGHCYYYGCHKGMTKLYKCKYCEKYFCKDHLDPTIPSLMSRSLPAHPCAKYRIWQEDKEKIEIGRRLDSLNRLIEVWPFYPIHKKRESFIPSSKSIRPKFSKYLRKIPVKWIAFGLIISFIVLYLHSNPQIVSDITEKVSDITEKVSDTILNFMTNNEYQISIKDLNQNPSEYIWQDISISGKLNIRYIKSPFSYVYSLESNDGYWVLLHSNCIDSYRNYNYNFQTYTAKGEWIYMTSDTVWTAPKRLDDNYRLVCTSPII